MRRWRHCPATAPAVTTLAGCESLDVYLAERGEVKLPADRRGLAEAALLVVSGGGVRRAQRVRLRARPVRGRVRRAGAHPVRGHVTATVVAPVLGIALDHDTIELPLGDGLSLIRGDALGDVPDEAVWGDTDEPHVLALLAIDHEHADRSPVSIARTRFRRILSALRLFERGGYALGPVAWARSEAGSWRPIPIGVSGRTRLLTLIPPPSRRSCARSTGWSPAARPAAASWAGRWPGLRWAASGWRRWRRSPTTCWRSARCWSPKVRRAVGWRIAWRQSAPRPRTVTGWPVASPARSISNGR